MSVEKMRSGLHGFVDLFVKWFGILLMLFLAEYAVDTMIESYKNSSNLGGGIIVILLLVAFSAMYALVTMGWPPVQKVIDGMFGDKN